MKQPVCQVARVESTRSAVSACENHRDEDIDQASARARRARGAGVRGLARVRAAQGRTPASRGIRSRSRTRRNRTPTLRSETGRSSARRGREHGDAETGWVEPDDGACPASHPVKAKLASGIFHVPGGANYDRTQRRPLLRLGGGRRDRRPAPREALERQLSRARSPGRRRCRRCARSCSTTVGGHRRGRRQHHQRGVAGRAGAEIELLDVDAAARRGSCRRSRPCPACRCC